MGLPKTVDQEPSSHDAYKLAESNIPGVADFRVFDFNYREPGASLSVSLDPTAWAILKPYFDEQAATVKAIGDAKLAGTITGIDEQILISKALKYGLQVAAQYPVQGHLYKLPWVNKRASSAVPFDGNPDGPNAIKLYVWSAKAQAAADAAANAWVKPPVHCPQRDSI